MLRCGLVAYQTGAFRNIYHNRKIRPLLGTCRAHNVKMLQCDKIARSVRTARAASWI